ncbi:MAG TPA: hypothetical protein VMX56_00865 [Anaerolineales bacterium]|nr:hypothetical protein [Anaerolineales bacterium]
MIIAAILELIQNLQKNKDEEILLRRMASPRIHEFRVVMSALYDKGLRGRELISTTRETLEEMGSMNRDEHVALLATAKDFKPGMLAPDLEG